ncbi:MAG TPA: hypothetical protein VK452_00735 [Dissulfurispiraceae bacterium]|nr:hypothetical protein [Dissulfurispiraceae bacterium]
MKGIIALTVLLAFLITSSFVFAAEDQIQSAPTAPAPKANAKPKLSFEEMKANKLERNDKAIAKLKEIRECIEKAQTPDDLKACHPKRSHHYHKKTEK